MFRAPLCPSSGAYQLQQQPLVYRSYVVVAVLLAVVGRSTNHKPVINCCIELVDLFDCPKYLVLPPMLNFTLISSLFSEMRHTS